MIYLVLLLPASSLQFSPIAQSATLHSGKDLAVSLFDFAQNLATLSLYEDSTLAGCLTSFVSGVSARTSHLTVYGSYPLPSLSEIAKCPDFPHSASEETAV